MFTEGGVRRFREGRTEAELAVKLEKVIDRLAAGAVNMERPGAVLGCAGGLVRVTARRT